MQADGPLRRRLIAACVLLAVLIGGVFSAAAYVIVEAVEAELVQGRLSRAAKVVARSIREGGEAPSLFDLKSHIEPGIPQALRALPPGFHEVETDDDTLAVLVGEEGGRRYVVVDDISDFERLEFIAFSALAVALLAGVLLALAIARASANRIVSPISALADAVEHDRLAAHPVLLAAPDEIGVLARAFMSRAAELAAVLERERHFTADVSHELRTPLTVVLGAAELLTARLAERPDLLQVAQRILRTTSGMSEQVSALLQLARDPGRIERSTLALRDLLEREVERCRPLLDGKAVSLELDAPNEVWMQGNEDLAAIAIGNLLRNACHFTERGLVRATLRADRLAVEDTGPGIPAEVRGRLFEPFVRGDHSSTTGTGLGLSIVKRVADHLGWRVQHDDAPHGGARFTLIFAAP